MDYLEVVVRPGTLRGDKVLAQPKRQPPPAEVLPKVFEYH